MSEKELKEEKKETSLETPKAESSKKEEPKKAEEKKVDLQALKRLRLPLKTILLSLAKNHLTCVSLLLPQAKVG